MARTFTIKKDQADVNFKTGRMSFDPDKQLIHFSAYVRGADYDPGDGNYPKMKILALPSTIYAELELTPDLLSPTQYRWIRLTWDPRKIKPFKNDPIAVVGAVYDEDGDANGSATYTDTTDLRVPTTITRPLSDGIEADGLGNIIVIFKPNVIAWKQKFKPKVMRALKENMGDEELGGLVTHFSLKSDPNTWIVVDVAGGDYLKTLGETPWESCTVDWDETDVYWDEVNEIKANQVGIASHDSTTIPMETKMYFEIDYQAELL